MKKLLLSFLILLISVNAYAIRVKRQSYRSDFSEVYLQTFSSKVRSLAADDEIQFVYPMPEEADDKTFSSLNLFRAMTQFSGAGLLNVRMRAMAKVFVAGTFNKASKADNRDLLKNFILAFIKRDVGEGEFGKKFLDENIAPLFDLLKSVVTLGSIELKKEPFIDDWEEFKKDVLAQQAADASAISFLNEQGRLSELQKEKLILLLSPAQSWGKYVAKEIRSVSGWNEAPEIENLQRADKRK